MVRKVTHQELEVLINHYYNNPNKPSLFVWGNYGIGKSKTIEFVTKKLSSKKGKIPVIWGKLTYEERKEVRNNPEKYFALIDIRLSEYDSSDIKGVPIIIDNNRAIEFKIPSWALFLADERSDGILLFDEINTAVPLVMTSCYKIIYDRQVGESKINDNWLIIGAGNLDEDRGYTHQIPMPLLDRGGEVQLIRSSGKSWISWAIDNNIDKDIIGFISLKESALFNIVGEEDTQKNTTSRGWERVSNLKKTIPNKDYELLELICSSAIGEGISREFVSYCKIQEQINIEDIIKNPKKLEEIKEISFKYFIITTIADKYRFGDIDFKKVAEITKILDKMGSVEFNTLMWRLCLSYNEEDFRKNFMSYDDEEIVNKYAKYLK